MLIREKDKQAIVSIAQQTLKKPLKIWAYGSRVKGGAHDTSDLDLVLVSNDLAPVDAIQFVRFKQKLQDSTIPILVQVLDWALIPERFRKGIAQSYEELAVIDK